MTDTAFRALYNANGSVLAWESKASIKRIELSIVALVSALFCTILALRYGQDANWDLRNYHYYTVHSLLNGRMGIDIAPSQLQTWYNPIASVLQYAALVALPPRIASVLFSLFAASAIVLIYALTVRSLTPEWRQKFRARLGLAALACIGACSSPMFLSELGTTFADIPGGILVLIAIYVLIARDFSRTAYFIGGISIGIAVGLKLTNAFYFIGWLAALLAVERWRFVYPAMLTGLGAALAYLPVGGLWVAYIAGKTGNPLFPHYNQIFESGLYLPVPLIDERFRPKGVGDMLYNFVAWPMGHHPTAEIPFSDIRFTVLAAAILAVLSIATMAGIRALLHREHRTSIIESAAVFEPRIRIYLTVFVIVSLAVWLVQFGIQRYAVALELLAPLTILMLLSRIAGSLRTFLIGSVLCIMVIVLVSAHDDWGRVRFSHSWFDVRIPAELQTGDTLFVMLSGEPTAYIAPFLPASSVFVRIEGNMPITPTTGLGEMISGKIAAHTGTLRTLTPAEYPIERSRESLSAYGLHLDLDRCVEIETKIDNFRSCLLQK